jgi:hypothetical protein
LALAYRRDTTGADGVYKGKRIVVVGPVETVGTDFLDMFVENMARIRARLDGVGQREIADVRAGQTVSLSCIIDGTGFYLVEMSQCHDIAAQSGNNLTTGQTPVTAAPQQSLLRSLFGPQVPQEEERRQTAEADRKKLDEDQSAAARMGVSLATFRWGSEASVAAFVICKDNVIDNSRYGGRSDWFPKYGWSINEQRTMIRIDGEDVRLKNTFGTEEYVRYSCMVHLNVGYENNPNSVHDPSAWSAQVISVAPLHP